MFEPSPANPSQSRAQTRAQNAAPSRATARPRAAGPARQAGERTFDILAVWDDDIRVLKEHVDIVSSWGPYELFECIALFHGADGRRRVLCRFAYHGATSSRLTPDSTAQFKYALLNCLRQITQWEDVAGKNHMNPQGA